jgi:hypothetical protein
VPAQLLSNESSFDSGERDWISDATNGAGTFRMTVAFGKQGVLKKDYSRRPSPSFFGGVEKKVRGSHNQI